MLSPFHQEMLLFLRDQVGGRGEVPTSLEEALKANSAAGFEEIVKEVHRTLAERATQVERKWISSFSEKEFKDIGMERWFPRIYRGLPRVYHRDDPSRSAIKEEFTHLSRLRKLSVDRAVFSLYEAMTERPKVAILVWVIPDGMGDWIAALETAQALEREAQVQIIAVSAWDLSSSRFETQVIRFAKDPKEVVFPDEVVKSLREADLILQIPTFSAGFEELLKKIKERTSSYPMPQIEQIGEYGYLESSWFHPNTVRRSMGLHMLEKGIFIKKSEPASFEELEDRKLSEQILGGLRGGQYLEKTHFHFAYLSTHIGGAIYLHALLKMWEKDEKGIDLCTPDIGWFIQGIEKVEGASRFASYGISKIEVWVKGELFNIQVQEEGKVLRVISPGLTGTNDVRRLMFLSEGWIGVRGNQSLSEVIATGKPFFYDGREHARYFMKDLMALAQNRLASHPFALRLFRATNEAFLWNLPPETEEWVDETHFQSEEKRGWQELALEMGTCLQNPTTQEGFNKFMKIVTEEYAFNPFLLQLVRRERAHRANPALAREEERLMGLYGDGIISFTALVKNLKVCMMRL
jgi:hypothetical protein